MTATRSSATYSVAKKQWGNICNNTNQSRFSTGTLYTGCNLWLWPWAAGYRTLHKTLTTTK